MSNTCFVKIRKIVHALDLTANRRAAECSANCCFPFLSGGDGVIDLGGDDVDEDEN